MGLNIVTLLPKKLVKNKGKMKRVLLPTLVIGVLLLGGCGELTPIREYREPEVILEFGELAADHEEAKWENELGRWKPATAIINGEEKPLTSQYFKTNTRVEQNSLGRVKLYFEWKEEGGKLCEAITSRLIGQPMAIFEADEDLRAEDGRPIAPTVQLVIVARGVITGLSLNDAERLPEQLNTGR